jgi:predicted dehydrogenase
MRFEGKHEALKRYADAGLLGEVYYAHVAALRQRGAPGWGAFLTKRLSGGGPLIDIGVHVLDLTLWMMGFPRPVAVSGVAPTKLANLPGIVNRPGWGDWRTGRKQVFDVEDFAAGFVRFRNGAVLSLEVSWLLNIREPEYQKIWLMGTKAGAEWPALTIFGEKAGCITDSQLAFPNDRADGHHTELAAFKDAILRKKPSPVPPEQSLNVQRILHGLYQSYKAGKEVKV